MQGFSHPERAVRGDRCQHETDLSAIVSDLRTTLPGKRPSIPCQHFATAIQTMCPRDFEMIPSPTQIAAARTLARLSQTELAAEARVGVATLRRYENGRSKARADTLDAVVRALRAHGIVFVDEDDQIEMGVLLLKDRPRGGKRTKSMSSNHAS